MNTGNTISIGDQHYWSGQGETTIPGLIPTYSDVPGIVEISEVTERQGMDGSQISVSMSVDNATLTRYLQDVGKKKVVINWIIKDDSDADWTLLPYQFTGTLNGYTIVDRKLLFNVQSGYNNIRPSKTKYWSNESQQSAHSGDTGFVHMRRLTETGIETGWPQ